MIQGIIDGIISAIQTEYGENTRVYTESLEQGLKEPCFSVLCLVQSNEQKFSYRNLRTYTFIIRYFPSTEEPILECQGVCEVLYDILSDITPSDDDHIIHSSRMDGNIVDGVLQFQVSYTPFAWALPEYVDMEDADINTKVQ